MNSQFLVINDAITHKRGGISPPHCRLATPHLINICLPLAEIEEIIQVMINKTLMQLVSVRLPFVRPEVAADDKFAVGRYDNGIISRECALKPACKARVFIGD